MISKRGLLLGGLSILAAPAIVRASSLMPISVLKPQEYDPILIDIIRRSIPSLISYDIRGVQWMNRLQSVKGSTHTR